MGCSASRATVGKEAGGADAHALPPPPSGGLLEAGRGGWADARRALEQPRPLTVFLNTGNARVGWCTPAERRWAELEPREYLDPGEKREARFVVSRAAFGLRGEQERVPFCVGYWALVVDAPGWLSLRAALAHASVPELGGLSLRLEGAAIDALLADSGAVSVTRHGGEQYAVRLPLDMRTRTLAPGAELEVRAAAAREGVRLRLAVCAMLGDPASEHWDAYWGGVPPARGLQHAFRVASAPAPAPGDPSATVPLSGALRGGGKGPLRCLLRALLVAVPGAAGRVARLELLLDGRVVLQVPAAVAAMGFEGWVAAGGGHYARHAPHGSRAHYCLSLGACQGRMQDELLLCGELDLTAPGMQDGRLELRVVYGPDGAPAHGEPGAGGVFVQACLLA